MLSTNTFQRPHNPNQNTTRSFWRYIHIDLYLLTSIVLLTIMGLVILFSASSQNMTVIEQQILHISIAFAVMVFFAQIPPLFYQRWAGWLYGLGLVFLVAVLFVGHIGKGA